MIASKVNTRQGVITNGTSQMMHNDMVVRAMNSFKHSDKELKRNEGNITSPLYLLYIRVNHRLNHCLLTEFISVCNRRIDVLVELTGVFFVIAMEWNCII